MRSSYSLVACLLLSGCAIPVHVETYNAPLTSVGARFGELPAAVQNAVRAQTGTAEIRDIDKEVLSGVGTVYRVTYVNEGLYPPLFVDADGSVLNPDMTVAVGAVHDETTVHKGGAAGGLHFADLPGPVARVVENSAPKSEILAIDEENWGSQVVYIIGFRDETRNPKLYVAADGTILRAVHR